jgi:hypothetical protein
MKKIIIEIPNLDYIQDFDIYESINKDNLKFNKLLEKLIR